MPLGSSPGGPTTSLGNHSLMTLRPGDFFMRDQETEWNPCQQFDSVPGHQFLVCKSGVTVASCDASLGEVVADCKHSNHEAGQAA
jgi:hypothetical protein